MASNAALLLQIEELETFWSDQAVRPMTDFFWTNEAPVSIPMREPNNVYNALGG